MFNWRGRKKTEQIAAKTTTLIDNTAKRAVAPTTPQPVAPALIRRVITVSSAKGGVGKSTVAVNLAVAMAKVGLNVGLLDADVYGPSCHVLLGTQDTDPIALDDGRLAPVTAHSVKSFSIAYVSNPDTPMLWRGPIVSRSIQKMYNETAWASKDAPLDILIIDTPPGTGEAHLTLAQSLPVDAAILVTTPSAIALADVVRGAGMYDKLETPILGVVEMMSHLDLPSGRTYPLGKGGAEKIAEKTGVPVLAQIPILESINTANETGHPIALSDEGRVFLELGQAVAAALDALTVKIPPRIIFED